MAELGTTDGALRVIGTRPVRHDGADKVTGRALYGADLQIAGMLHGKILRSPHAHARILSIDTSKAESLPWVHAVVTASDFPPTAPGHMSDLSHWSKGLYPTKYLRDNILASDKVLYQGHAVAAVAAANQHAAEQALELIDVQYEPLSPVLDCREALRDGAPILHDDLRTSTLGEAPAGPTNLAAHFKMEAGDVGRGFEEATAVVDRDFHTGTVHQGYIEPHNTTALWNEDGRLTVWSSTQGSFFVRDYLQLILGLSDSNIRCVPMEIGGGFGGKFELYGEPVAALLSRKSGRPVKVVMSRGEEFTSTGPAPGGYVRIKVGARSDGTITAIDADLTYEAGAYPGSPVAGGSNALVACYDVPNVRIEGRDVVVNRPKAAAYRAPGYPNAAFAMEQAIDELARKLSIDPLDMRLRNAAEEGTRRADGVVYPRIGFKETIEAMRDHPHYSDTVAGRNIGRGVAVGMMIAWWWKVFLLDQRELGRNSGPGGRFHRHWRYQDLYSDAGGRSAGHSRSICASSGCGHGLDWVYARHGRQPRHLRHRFGRNSGRGGRARADGRTRRRTLGRGPGIVDVRAWGDQVRG